VGYAGHGLEVELRQHRAKQLLPSRARPADRDWQLTFVLGGAVGQYGLVTARVGGET
jgi:hypothetical protein